MKTILNIICRKNVKYSIILFLLLLIYVGLSIIFYVINVTNSLESSVFRLHVIANSDSKEDQNLKYKVRDNIIEYLNTISEGSNSKEDIVKIAKTNKHNICDIARKTVENSGFDYDVSVEIGNYSFPTKIYGDIKLPSGNYDALEVKIGESKGQNWWCVLFPPLCFIDVSSGIVPEESKEILESQLTEEEYGLISNSDSSKYHFKFKLIELLGENNILTAKK